MRIVAAFYPVAEAAARVGGPRVHVTNLTPAGAEPHDLELVPSEVDEIQDADLVLVMGHGFQPAVEKAARDRHGVTVTLLDRLPIRARVTTVRSEQGGGGSLDPHVWLDPVLMRALVDVVARAVVRVDRRHAQEYLAGAHSFEQRLSALDAAFARGLRDCRRRVIVTAHEAFGWLARRYGLRQVGVAGIDPTQEPSTGRLAQLADLVRRERVTTIFTEALVSPRVARALEREAGGLRTAVLDPLESLTHRDRRAGRSYVAVMEHNLATLRTALGCR